MRIILNRDRSKLPAMETLRSDTDNPLISWLRDNIGAMADAESWLNIKGDGWHITYEIDSLQPWTIVDFELKLIIRFDEPISDILLTDFCLRFT